MIFGCLKIRSLTGGVGATDGVKGGGRNLGDRGGGEELGSRI